MLHKEQAESGYFMPSSHLSFMDGRLRTLAKPSPPTRQYRKKQ